MEITIKGTEKELQAASGMIDHQMLTRMLISADFPDGIVLQMGLHNPNQLEEPVAESADNAAMPEAATPKVETSESPKAKFTKRITRIRRLLNGLTDSTRAYVFALHNAGKDGITDAALKRVLKAGRIGPVRGSFNRAARDAELEAPDLIHVFESRGKDRRALTPLFSKAVAVFKASGA